MIRVNIYIQSEYIYIYILLDHQLLETQANASPQPEASPKNFDYRAKKYKQKAHVQRQSRHISHVGL